MVPSFEKPAFAASWVKTGLSISTPKRLHVPEEQKAKLREAKKRENLSAETLKKMSESAKNRSEETRNKISESAKERYKDPTKVPFYGKHHTEETKQILRNAQNKAVVCLTKDKSFIAEFDSVTCASKETGISTKIIINCCKRRIETYNDIIFMYKSDYAI